ncbi:DsbE family thiol:disulfide interchange protein [Rodentibacter pneumotropicus]|uniref:Cytochrome c-type biogenesis/thiol:disulfide interchange protein CcmG n=1 Tax=Rodentibacter pneumotropicus TaxID=758 RepID=A0A448MM17_9PAST|nr:DsbE family thiol:disulfide interchange protein [Rodentibacter pneumotropicus]NBH74561.1 DsbE family thiol:disulfide interchange protein [Rodentibacter pneumotropicus]OOF62637.1 thiol:disulfide interchange protein [Rodentibacter pneumotropicus]OOF63132.1 thiol:disulfide interchange protein [Rodentibacter pneumotropicus]TGZ99821.1 DsbE family thiol:disulfide interchange protein [Rodentibacter pneumotropicus]THA00076.1 DsbE family thiol:disulfide interchange protein [Rodentibacter pneumotropi
MKKKLLIPLVFFSAVVIAFLVQLHRNAQGEDIKALESALVGKPIPMKTLTELFENKSYDKELFRQGKPILLNVWATWCPTCYAEHQYLNKLAQQGVSIIGLNYKDDSAKAIKWLKDLGNPYQVVLKDEKGSFGLDLGVYGAPETFIVDGKGIIHYRLAGDVNEKVWLETLKPIYDKLAEQPQ